MCHSTYMYTAENTCFDQTECMTCKLIDVIYEMNFIFLMFMELGTTVGRVQSE